MLTPTVIGNTVYTSTKGGGSFLFEITKTDDGFAASQKWNINNVQGYMSSPVHAGGYVYQHADNKKLSCIELATGKVMWTTEQTFGTYWSIITNGDKALALDSSGELILFSLNPAKFELLARKKVTQEEAWAYPALVDGELVIRDLKNLTVWRWR